MASGDTFHFIDLSAQNAINQYHFITLIVFESSIMFWTMSGKKNTFHNAKHQNNGTDYG